MASPAESKSKEEEYRKMELGTRAIHCGQEPDPSTGAVCTPISLSTTFAQFSPGVKMGRDLPLSYHEGLAYSRSGNPTRTAFEIAIAGVESGKHGLAFASGMAAISALMHLMNSGDNVVCIEDVYGGTQRYFRKTAGPSMGITFTFVDTPDLEKVKAAFTDKTKMMWIESPTNPTLTVWDIRKIADIAHEKGALLVVDNTFMSPYFQRPLELGADFSMNSCTKYINGHSDVVMGSVTTNSDEHHAKLKFIQKCMGAVPSPFDCYLCLRGLKTLHVRMKRHAENALEVAKFLEGSEHVEKVIYPGLPSHPQHELHKSQSSGDSGMVAMYVKGGLDGARKFMESVRVFTLAESLGAVESLCGSPVIMTHASVAPEIRAELGISDNLVRLSIGIEHIDDLIADLKQALEKSQA